MAVAQEYGQPTRSWAGWLIFAAIMLVIAGTFQAIAGLTALFNETYYVVPSSDLLVEVNYTAWGWTHIGIAALLLISAASLASGHMVGRIIGIVVASLSAIVNLAFLSAQPVWSVTMIAIDVFVIFAIAVHGRELGDS